MTSTIEQNMKTETLISKPHFSLPIRQLLREKVVRTKTHKSNKKDYLNKGLHHSHFYGISNLSSVV